MHSPPHSSLQHRALRVENWGRTRYRDAVALQRERLAARRDGTIPDTLIFTEHNPVYTIGVRKGAESHLIWDDALCNRMGVEVEKTSRGGDITFHGPGQIVGYPILDLRNQRDLHRYLRELEECLIRALGTLGLAASRNPGKTGIWLGDRKIAAIGVAVKSWITWHGFALNVCTDLGYFQGIVPCGITEGSVTSIKAELSECPSEHDVRDVITSAFKEVFGFDRIVASSTFFSVQRGQKLL